MKKIKDRLLLGIVSGLIGAIPGRLLNTAEYRKGLVDMKYGQMAANLFTNKALINTPHGKILGSLANELLTTTTGTAITYVLSATGRDHRTLKGMSVGILYWFLLNGLGTKLTATTNKSKPISHIYGLFDHLLFGAITAEIATRLGDDSLFPDNEIKTKNMKLPLVFMD